MSKKNLFKCRRKLCNFLGSKFQVRAHERRCPLNKKIISKSSTKTLESIKPESIHIGRVIGSGGYGSVVLAKAGRKDFVIKNATVLDNQNFLLELEIYQKLNTKYPGEFPQLLGHERQNRCLYLERLNTTLDKLLNHDEIELSESDIFEIGIQLVHQLKKLHSLGYVYRDLKENNVMLKGNKVVLIDFGCCAKYDEKRKKGPIFGPLKFLSRQSHLYFRQKPRDDIENLIYMIIIMLNNQRYPWSIACLEYHDGIAEYDVAQKRVYHLKKNNLCDFRNFPPELYLFINEIQSIETFEAFPYDKLIEIFSKYRVKEPKLPLIPLEDFCVERKLIEANFWGLTEPQRRLKFEFATWEGGVEQLYFEGLRLDLKQREEEIKKMQTKEFQIEFLVISTDFDWHKTTTLPKIPIIFIMFWEQPIQHSCLMIWTGNFLVTFNGKESLNPEIPLLKKSKCWEKQEDDWTGGYRVLYWIKQIQIIGLKKWIRNVEGIDVIQAY